MLHSIQIQVYLKEIKYHIIGDGKPKVRDFIMEKIKKNNQRKILL